MDDLQAVRDAYADASASRRPEVQTWTASQLIRLGHAQEAFELTSQAIELAPNDPAPYALRSVAGANTGDHKQAVQDARKALKLDETNALAKRVLKLYEGRESLAQAGAPKGLDQARGLTGEAKAAPPAPMAQAAAPAPPAAAKQPAPILAGAGPAFARGTWQSKPPAAVLALTNAPGISETGKNLVRSAAAALSMGDPAKAVTDATRAIELSPQHTDAYNVRGRAYNHPSIARYGEAVQDAGRALELVSRNAPAFNVRAFAFNRLGRPKEALVDAEAAVAIAPRDPGAYLNRGQAHEQLGDTLAMLRDYKAAASLDPPRYHAHYKEKARANGVEPEPLSLDPSLFAPDLDTSAIPASPRAGRGRPFLPLVIGSLIGGFLVALGLLHGVFGRKGPAAETAVPAPAPAPVARLRSNYLIHEPIGKGGMGVVYAATDLALDRRVAIKKMREEIKGDRKERERFIKEAKTVAGLHHPSIVDIHSIVDEDGELYLVFEYVEGRTVSSLLTEKQRLTVPEAKGILRPVCQALEYAHGRKVIHRDLKPSNVMVTEIGQVKVMDFGIARQAKDSLAKFSVTNTVIGTPQYMAPEAEQGVVCRESDVYSLGAMTYEMLSGAPPSNGSAPKQPRAPAPLADSVPGIPAALDTLLAQALEPDPKKRIKSPQEFWLRLEEATAPTRHL